MVNRRSRSDLKARIPRGKSQAKPGELVVLAPLPLLFLTPPPLLDTTVRALLSSASTPSGPDLSAGQKLNHQKHQPNESTPNHNNKFTLEAIPTDLWRNWKFEHGKRKESHLLKE
jgi:hypothetical protein